MKSSRAKHGLPISVRRALLKLGADVSTARRRRRIPMELLAQRAFITRKTLSRIERGDSGVSLGIFASVMFGLGLLDRVTNLVDPSSDALGLQLEEGALPRRIRRPGRGA